MGVISLTMIRVDWIYKGNGEAHPLSIKNICMKVRLYHDERVSAKDAPDAWSIYCPYPKSIRGLRVSRAFISAASLQMKA